MNQDKQIEEMASDLENHTCMSEFQAEIASRMLYAKGYRKASDVAREIFEEIEAEIELALKSNYNARREHTEYCNFVSMIDGKINALRGIEYFLAELKKKYTEG